MTEMMKIKKFQSSYEKSKFGRNLESVDDASRLGASFPPFSDPFPLRPLHLPLQSSIRSIILKKKISRQEIDFETKDLKNPGLCVMANQ